LRELTSQELVDRVTGATMRVESHLLGLEKPLRGTGVLVDADRRLVLTASHVVSGGSSFEVRYGDREIDATLHANAPCDDLAMLQLVDKPRGLTELPVHGSDDLKPGDRVLAAGFGTGKKPDKPQSRFGAVTAANIPAEPIKSLPSFQSAVEHSAVVKEGDSGGPLLDSRGRVVGINNAFVPSRDSGARDRYFAMSGSMVKELLPGLVAGKSRMDLGWKLRADTRELIRQVLEFDIGPDWDGAIVVAGLTRDSPADKALSNGDVIVEMRGEPTASVGDVCRILAGQSGSSVSVLAGSKARPNGWKTTLRVP
jgi:S1-C subfamily serine protease